MRTTRTSPTFLAAALVGAGLASTSALLPAQDLPAVRPSSEIFGNARPSVSSDEQDASGRGSRPAAFSDEVAGSDELRPVLPPSRSPFSVLEPDWEADPKSSPTSVKIQPDPGHVPTTAIDSSPELLPVQSLQFPELEPPLVDSAAALLVSPIQHASSLPILTAPEEADPVELQTFVPKPVADAKAEPAAPTASAQDLEGMLHSMVWVTGTIGLGAVVSLWMLKLWLTRGGRVSLPSKSLKLVDTLRIGPRCGIYLVEAETHRVLVGVEHGKTMCLMPLPASFTESLDAAGGDEPEESKPAPGFERVADVFSALRSVDRAKGASS